MRSRLDMLRVLWAVYRGWRRAPSQRLCQLFHNALFQVTPDDDHFYVEDDVVVERVGGYGVPL